MAAAVGAALLLVTRSVEPRRVYDEVDRGLLVFFVGLFIRSAVMLLRTAIPSFPNRHTGWLVLAMSSTLAGNLTITGSIANIIVVERAAAEGVTISVRDYLRVGVPVTAATLVIGTLRLAFTHY
jgi:Na+/H+ antiporter NhaD/arsenite permease-like protein